jgi:hypothetical protein
MNLEASGGGLMEVLFRHLPGGAEETHGIVQGTRCPDATQTELLPNTDLERFL